MKRAMVSGAAIACAVAMTLVGRRAGAQGAASPPGCERSTLTLPRVTDAHGAPVARWTMPSHDRVADEGAAFLQAFDSNAPDAVSSRQGAVRAWAASHADHPVAQYVLGRMFSELGQTADAIAAYNAALRLAPGLADAEYNLGVVLAQGGRPEDAVMHFDRAASLDRQSVDALYNAGMALYLRGTYDRALEHWCAARRIAPNDFDSAKKVVQALNALGMFADADRARAAVGQLRAHSSDPQVRAMRSYVIDQRHVGNEDVMAEEVFPANDPSLQYYYAFNCTRGNTRVRTVTLEGSAVAREQGVAALVGIEFPDGSHATTTIAFRTMPSYQTLRPVVEDLIGRLQRGDNSMIGATSRSH